LNRPWQQGQVPPNSVTRVTSGVVAGISIRSYAWIGIWATPVTSARQCGQRSARTSRRRVGSGCSGRWAPLWGLSFGCAFVSPFALCRCDGGVLELSGVFGGRISFSRSATFSAFRMAFSASSAAIRLASRSTHAVSASIRASNAPICVLFSEDKRMGRSGGGVMTGLIHEPLSAATGIYHLSAITRLEPRP
jgi:hypothetical protein